MHLNPIAKLLSDTHIVPINTCAINNVTEVWHSGELKGHEERVWAQQGMILRPPDYESGALTN
jgi:hypothetical protein